MSKYTTIEAASIAAINLGIKSRAEYNNRYQDDPRLHSTPHSFFRDDWQAFGTWYGFLGNDIPDYYPTIEAASKAAINLGIKSRAEYNNRFQEDPRLHSTPHSFYRDDWQAFGTWYGFLGNNIPDYYPTIEAASKAAINLGIKSQSEYKKRYKEDPRLHSNPHRFYRDDWQAYGTWYGFLG
ncbi:integrase, partial [Shewanella sp. 10N.7]|uniref:integrase repeat-containing protein n=1 Tax=Shewanella sp. 10N.7 TaxID=2885093 RepID=UPI002D1F9D6D